MSAHGRRRSWHTEAIWADYSFAVETSSATGVAPDARTGRAATAPERPPLTAAPPWRSRSLPVLDRRARRCRIGPGALLRPGPPKNRTCAFQRIRLKQAGEGAVARRRTIRSRSWSVSSAGRFTATLVAASNLSVGSGVVVIFASLAHLTASARFPARAPGPGSGRLCGTAACRGRPSRPGFPLRFAAGVRFSVIRFPPGVWAFLAVGLPARGPDLDGVTAFRTHELRPGWVPSIPRGRRCSSRPRDVLSRRLPLCHGQSLVPAAASHRQGSASRGIDEGSRDSPVRSSLACGRPGGTGRPWASPRASHPAVTDDARRGWDRPSSTDLELHAQSG